MKTGKIAQLLGGIDQQTVNNWVSRPEFETYFSDTARRIGVTQRDFDERDRMILNTIRELRQKDSNISWEEIRAKLDSGYRAKDWPTTAATVKGFAPLEMMTSSAMAIAERDKAIGQVRELEARIEDLRKALTDAERAANDRLRERDEEWVERMMEREGLLREQIGQLKYMLKKAGIDPNES